MITSLIKQNKLVFILFCLCQIISIISIVFVYGVFVSRDKLNNSYDIERRELTFKPSNIEDKNLLSTKFQQLESNVQLKKILQTITVWSISGDNIIKSDFRYKDPAPLYVDHGSYFNEDDYLNGNHVILINRSIAGTDPVYNVDDNIQINGTAYKVVGVFGHEYYEIPFPSLISYDDVEQISIVLNREVEESTARQYSQIIKEIFDVNTVNLPPPITQNAITQNLFQTVSSIFIAFIAAINFSALYRFLLKERQAEYAIYRMCGCTKKRGFMLFLSELLIIGLCLFTFSSLLFHFALSWIYPYMTSKIIYAITFIDYLGIGGLYLLNLLIVFIPIINSYSSKSPIDVYRRV